MSIETAGATLKNPGLPGDFSFDTVIYGSPPLAYPVALNSTRSTTHRTRLMLPGGSTFRHSRTWAAPRRGHSRTPTYR
jgi:hypothetical protein